MPWLRVGTVAVTTGSTTVVGADADFAANAKNGDAFVGPDGATYEIGNVASATVLSIIPAYKGPTVSGAGYAIMPVQGYPKALADAFNEINREWGVKLAALGATANYDILPIANGGTGYGTKAEAKAALDILDIQTIARGGTGADNAAAALTNLGALGLSGGKMTGALNEATVVNVPSAATVDIGAASANTVLIGGTSTITSFGVASSGARRNVIFQGVLTLTHNAATLQLPGSANIQTTSGDSAEFISLGAGAWFCIRYTLTNGKNLKFSYDRSNSVGTVSQASGLPTGALMEYINNSNGEAWKFACGAVIMITTGARSIVVGTPVGTASAMYYPGAPSSGSNRPVSVVGTPFDWLTIEGGAGLNFAVPVGSPQAGTYRQFYHLSLAVNSAQNYTYSYLSIGRWY